MSSREKYKNFLSRVLMKRSFKNQFAVPEPPPKALESFLIWYEKNFLDVNISDIRIEKPIFIISLPRTGSSILQDVLCTHPDMAYITNLMHVYHSCFCAAEKFRRQLNLNVAGERYLKDSIIIESTSPADPVGTWTKWVGTDPYSFEYEKLTINRFSPGQINNIYNHIKRILWCFNQDGRPHRFILKMPGLLSHITFLKELFPDAKFIHLIRDARPTANSMVKLYHLCQTQLNYIRKKKGNSNGDQRAMIPYPRLQRLPEYIYRYGPDNIRTTAHLWNDAIQYFDSNRPLLENVHDIRYEDFIQDPKGEAAKAFAFCELPPTATDNDQFQNIVNKIGKINHKNTYAHYETIERICQATMQQYGYL